MSMLEFIKYYKIKMIKKILILLPIVALSACAIAKSQEEKEIESQCNYYKNTPNTFNEKLFFDYSKAKSAYLILEDKKFSCNNSICKTLASGNKWDFIEVELDGDPSNQSDFPKKGDSGLYKIYRDFEMYDKFDLISKDMSQMKLPLMSCNEDDSCISCASGYFCLVGYKIDKPVSSLIIKRSTEKKYSEKNRTILVNYNISINNDLLTSVNEFSYSIKQPYSSFGYGICTNREKIKTIMIEVLGGYKNEKLFK